RWRTGHGRHRPRGQRNPLAWTAMGHGLLAAGLTLLAYSMSESVPTFATVALVLFVVAKPGSESTFSYTHTRKEPIDGSTSRRHGSALPPHGSDMPRQPRIDLPDVTQHVVQRGNDRQPCFFADIDRTRYLQDLRELVLREHCRVHAYVLMTNHVHLLLTPSEQGQVGRLMQAL